MEWNGVLSQGVGRGTESWIVTGWLMPCAGWEQLWDDNKFRKNVLVHAHDEAIRTR